MSVLHLVRHGRVVDHLLDGSEDPPLSDIGHAQAKAASAVLRGDYLATSPYRRCLETAEPIAAATGLEVVTVSEVGEVVPEEYDPDRRRTFLRDFMGGAWSGQPEWLCEWRRRVLDALGDLARRGDEVIVVSHYVAINVAAGAATSDDRTTVFHPTNCSISTFQLVDGKLTAVSLGAASHLPTN